MTSEKVKGRAMLEKLRNRHLALGAAFFFISLGAIDTTYAAGPGEEIITLSDAAPSTFASLTIGGTNGVELPISNPATLNLSSVSSVDAQSIALVSVAARQIELAKTPEGARSVATSIIQDLYSDWNSSQISCLNQLWSGESHWNFQAHNYRSGAQGIAQALPPTKMEIVSTDWRTNPVTQIKWGLSYIKARYGSPCKALRTKHWRGYY
jgi:hypothetical protein